MSYAINVDWSEDTVEKWQNESQRVAIDALNDEEHPRRKEIMEYIGIDEDTQYPEESVYENFEPMMNYAYPLETTPDDEKILRVSLETNLCVMYNNDEDKYYMALTGGGMDLSQDIALAYYIIETWIPFDLALSVCTQPALSVSQKQWEVVKAALIDSLQKNIDNAQFQIKRLKNE